jgi:hypothetical protein
VRDVSHRHEPARIVHSMGEVTATRAVVYTQLGADASTRREEVWVKAGARWTFSPNGVANDGAPATTAN